MTFLQKHGALFQQMHIFDLFSRLCVSALHSKATIRGAVKHVEQTEANERDKRVFANKEGGLLEAMVTGTLGVHMPTLVIKMWQWRTRTRKY